MKLRKLLFWSHLIVGLFVGLFVAFMAATGSILALEPQIMAFAERRLVTAQSRNTASCISPGQMMLSVQQQTSRSVGTLELFADRRLPSQVQFGKEDVLFVDPCSGRVLQGGVTKVKSFLTVVRNLHESAAFGHERGGVLRDLKNATNLGFFFLILSGLILWIPRQRKKSSVRAVTTIRMSLRGRARDWNLHNVVGFWLALPLLAITMTGAIMSYSWAEGLLYRVSGSPAPAPHDEEHRIGNDGHDVNRASANALATPPSHSEEANHRGNDAAIDQKALPQTTGNGIEAHALSLVPHDFVSQHKEEKPQSEIAEAQSDLRSAPSANAAAASNHDDSQLEKKKTDEDRAGDDGHPGITHVRGAGGHQDFKDGEHPPKEHFEEALPLDNKSEIAALRPKDIEDPKRSPAVAPSESDLHQSTGMTNAINRHPQDNSVHMLATAPFTKLQGTPHVPLQQATVDHSDGESKAQDKSKHGGGKGHGPRRDSLVHPLSPSELLALDPVIEMAKRQVLGWQSLRLRLAGNGSQIVSFTFNDGDEAQGESKEQRAELQIDRLSGQLLQWTQVAQVSRGQRWRTYARFLHTGEIFGLPGQIVALIAALSALVLVWTGFALVIRRFFAWRSRTLRASTHNATVRQGAIQ